MSNSTPAVLEETVSLAPSAVFSAGVAGRGPLRLSKSLELVLGFIVLLELLTPFFTTTYGTDGPNQLYWIRNFTDLLSSGILLPHWLPASYHGMGAPSFYFYPPLAFYLTGIVRILTGVERPEFLFQTVGLLATLLSYYSCWRLGLKLNADRYTSILAAGIYTFAPFRFAELYYRSSLSSHVGYAVVPFFILAMIELLKASKSALPGKTAMYAVLLGILILTSIPLTLVIALLIFIAGITEFKRLNLQVVVRLLMGTAFGLGLSAFYLLPILEYKRFTHMEKLTEEVGFFLVKLIKFENQPALYYIAMFLAAGFLLMISFAARPAVETMPIARSLRKYGMVVTGLIFLLEIPAIGAPIWRDVPIVGLIQGNWRLYFALLLLMMAAVVLLRSRVIDRAVVATLWIWGLGSILPTVLILTNTHFYQHYVANGAEAPEYLSVYAKNADAGLKNELGIEQAQIFFPPLAEGERIDRIQNVPRAEEYSVTLQQGHSVTFHRFYWPSWHAYVDGRRIPVTPDSAGRASVGLPSGRHVVSWQLEKSSTEEAGLWFSGIAWSAALSMLGAGWYRNKKSLTNT